MWLFVSSLFDVVCGFFVAEWLLVRGGNKMSSNKKLILEASKESSFIHLRKRKQGKNGRISLHFEFYKGAVTFPDGKVKALREHEYPGLYIDDKPKMSAEKEHNKKILELDKSIKAKRELDSILQSK